MSYLFDEEASFEYNIDIKNSDNNSVKLPVSLLNLQWKFAV